VLFRLTSTCILRNDILTCRLLQLKDNRCGEWTSRSGARTQLVTTPYGVHTNYGYHGSWILLHSLNTQASDLHLGKSNCETKLAYSGENLSGAREYYDSLIAQGYSNHQALSYTHQHFPEFQIADLDSIGTQHQNQYDQQNTMMLQNLQQPVMLENQQQPVIFAAPSPQSNNSALKIVVIIAGIIAFFMIITVVLAGVLYVWASDLANNNQEDSPDLYQYIATDHTDAVDNGTENSLFVLQFSRAPNDLNWAFLNIQISGADGTWTPCNIDAGDGNCKLVQYGSDELTWEKSEIVHVTENGRDICSAAPCVLTIKISDVRTGVDDPVIIIIVVE